MRDAGTVYKTANELRESTSRLGRFWCWLWYGHTGEVFGKSLYTCKRCGKTIFGDY